MSEFQATEPNLPGLNVQATAAPAAQRATPRSAPRVKPIERNQAIWHPVDLERLIEPDHPVRGIWAFVEKLDLKDFYAPIEALAGAPGRAPWDPRLLVSLWVYAYSRGISSAREIERRCHHDPPFEWLCGLESINHHTLSDFRSAFGPALQELFVQALGVLSAGGLVSLERVMHDGTKIQACAASNSFRTEERLQAHLQSAREQLQALEQAATEEPTRQAAAQARAARERQQRVTEALEALAKIRQSKPEAKDKAAVRASHSDPQARIMKQSDGGYAPSYNAQLSTEASHKIIVACGISQNSSDSLELSKAVEQVQQNLGRKPAQVVVDGGYISGQNILEMSAQNVELIGPEPQRQEQPGSLRQRGVEPEFYPAAFVYDAQQNTYRCPAGQTLRHVGKEQRVGSLHHQYRADRATCQACPFQSKCCPANLHHGRSIKRVVQAQEVGQFHQKMRTPEVKKIYRQRSEVAEFPNAWLKAKLGLRQFRLRGLAKVLAELTWACLTYNIQQWIRLRWRPGLVARS